MTQLFLLISHFQILRSNIFFKNVNFLVLNHDWFILNGLVVLIAVTAQKFGGVILARVLKDHILIPIFQPLINNLN